MKPASSGDTTCWDCGEPFECGAGEEAPCWCASLPIVEIVPGAGAGCLCPACLRAKAPQSGHTGEDRP